MGRGKETWLPDGMGEKDRSFLIALYHTPVSSIKPDLMIPKFDCYQWSPRPTAAYALISEAQVKSK